jgi:hypothetical protein
MMKALTRRLLFGLPIPFLFGSKQANADIAPPSRFKSRPDLWFRTELYFGTGRPDGSVVSDAQFSQFVDEQVTPRFPDGLTLLAGYGQFKNSAGVINKEKSLVLILFYPPQMTDAGKLIEQIREAYKAMFQQESVLRADSSSVISF